VGAFLWCEAGQQGSDAPPGSLDGSLSCLSEQSFELCKGLFDRIEVGAIRRQEEQLCAGSADGPPDGLSLVAAEIVDNDDVAGPERGHQELLDISQEAFAVDRPVDHAGSIDAIMAQRGKEGQRPPSAMWRLGDQPLATLRAAMGAGHVG